MFSIQSRKYHCVCYVIHALMICQSLELAYAQTASLVAEAKHVSHDAVLVSICSHCMDGVLSVYWYGRIVWMVWGRESKWEKKMNYQKIIYNR